jgi:hypothetical protein
MLVHDASDNVYDVEPDALTVQRKCCIWKTHWSAKLFMVRLAVRRDACPARSRICFVSTSDSDAVGGNE